eukprot:755168-Hanusia_phi.AAC.3
MLPFCRMRLSVFVWYTAVRGGGADGRAGRRDCYALSWTAEKNRGRGPGRERHGRAEEWKEKGMENDPYSLTVVPQVKHKSLSRFDPRGDLDNGVSSPRNLSRDQKDDEYSNISSETLRPSMLPTFQPLGTDTENSVA